jgi:hypothetical protein
VIATPPQIGNRTEYLHLRPYREALDRNRRSASLGKRLEWATPEEISAPVDIVAIPRRLVPERKVVGGARLEVADSEGEEMRIARCAEDRSSAVSRTRFGRIQIIERRPHSERNELGTEREFARSEGTSVQPDRPGDPVRREATLRPGRGRSEADSEEGGSEGERMADE